MKKVFLYTTKVSEYSFKVFVCVQDYLINKIYMYNKHLFVKLTFGALLTIGVQLKWRS